MCSRTSRLVALSWRSLFALAALVATPAAAEPAATGLATSRTHLLRVRPRVAAGLEAGMPRSSAYAQAVALDLQERFDVAAARFREAEIEFGRMKPAGRRAHGARGVAPQGSLAGLLVAAARPAARGYRPWGSVAAGDLGYGYYLKFLAARAFTGHAPPGLASKARSLLESTVRNEPNNVFAHLSLAALLHEMGEPEQAQREYQRINLNSVQHQDAMLILRLAAYFSAAGDHGRALDHLERALQRPSMYRSLREMMDWSNEFDRLRDDPRFRRLIARIPSPTPSLRAGAGSPDLARVA